MLTGLSDVCTWNLVMNVAKFVLVISCGLGTHTGAGP